MGKYRFVVSAPCYFHAALDELQPTEAVCVIFFKLAVTAQSFKHRKSGL